MNRPAFVFSTLAFFAFVWVPGLARAEDPPKPADTPAPAPAAPSAPSGVVVTTGVPAKAEQPQPEKGIAVELSADDGRATIERRVATSSPGGIPFVETGLGVAHWEHTCVAPCADVKLDPRYAYRVAGDGLVPTDSFALPRDGRVRVDAKMGSSTGRIAGIVATGAGALAIVGGGLALAATPVLESEHVGSEGFRSAVLVGGIGAVSVGVVAASVGLFLWLANGSHAHTESVASAK